MIRVNLLNGKSKVGGQGAGVESPSATGASASGGTDLSDAFSVMIDDKVEVNSFEYSKGGQLLKILLLVIFAGGLYAYERYEKQKNQVIINSLKSELQEFETLKMAKSEKAGKLEEVKAHLEAKRKIRDAAKDLESLRLIALKSLDALQSATPRDVWLADVKFATGQVELNGKTFADTGLDTFVKNLQHVKAFSNVNVPRDVPETLDNGRTINNFKITFSTGELLDSTMYGQEGMF